ADLLGCGLDLGRSAGDSAPRPLDTKRVGDLVGPALVQHRPDDVIVGIDRAVPELHQVPPVAGDQLEWLVVAGQDDGPAWPGALEPFECLPLEVVAGAHVDEL